MNISRRRVFGFLAASPVAAKAAAESAAAQLAGISMTGFAGNIPIGDATPQAGNIGYGGRSEPTRAFFRTFGIPGFIRRQWEREARNVYRLDADLAGMRSMSLSAKLATQRRRNLAAAEGNFWKSLKFHEDQSKAQKWRERMKIEWW